MTERDQAALELAMKMAGEDATRGEQLDDMLADGEPWMEVAQFAAYCMQRKTLKLKPWSATPLDTDDQIDEPESYGRRPDEVALKRKMIALKISLYTPDPLAAIAEAEAKAATTKPAA